MPSKISLQKLVSNRKVPKYSKMKNAEKGEIIFDNVAVKRTFVLVGFLFSIIFLLYSTLDDQMIFLLQKTTANYFERERNYTWLDEYKQYMDQKQKRFERLSQWLDYDPRESVEPQFGKFIYSHAMDEGLGNQLYRYAALYAMGQMLNRTPVFSDMDYKIHQMSAELAIGIPEFYRRIYFLKPKLNENDIEKVPFEKNCCDYVDPKILLEHNQKRILMINGRAGNFENSKYFHHIRPQILRLFSFGPQIRDNVTALMQQIFKNDGLFKFCVHTRNGSGYGVSKAQQVGPAIDRIIQQLPRIIKRAIGNMSMVYFGEDMPLLHSLKFNTEDVYKMYYIADVKMSRMEEMHLAQRTCNLFLNTASLSSFDFWMGYLMPDDVPIFFIRKYVRSVLTNNTFDTLPPEWFPIEEDWLKRGN